MKPHQSSPATKHVATDSIPKGFTNFQKLPAEIRQAIWVLFGYGKPRIVSFAARPTRSTRAPRSPTMESAALVPTLLHVNSEARSVGLKIYNVKVGTSSRNQTYIDLKRDIVLVHDNYTLHNMLDQPTYRDGVRNLALGLEAFRTCVMSAFDFNKFSQLKHIDLLDFDNHHKRRKNWSRLTTSHPDNHLSANHTRLAQKILRLPPYTTGVAKLEGSQKYRQKTRPEQIQEMRKQWEARNANTPYCEPFPPSRNEFELLIKALYR